MSSAAGHRRIRNVGAADIRFTIAYLYDLC